MLLLALPRLSWRGGEQGEAAASLGWNNSLIPRLERCAGSLEGLNAQRVVRRKSCIFCLGFRKMAKMVKGGCLEGV